MDFQDRLKNAIDRGERRREHRRSSARDREMSIEELKSTHSAIRLKLSDRIESCVHQMIQHLPGFRLESMYGDRGWGAACYRDDIQLQPGGRGGRKSRYSRLELTVRPFSDYHVVDLSGKATVADKEIFSRNFYQKIDEADESAFEELIDVWVAEFAELYAAS